MSYGPSLRFVASPSVIGFLKERTKVSLARTYHTDLDDG
jgi:hypothetical protein